MEVNEYKKRFDQLYSNLLGASATFYSWKSLQNKDYEPIYHKANYFWSATLLALQNEWLLSLAKCFEKSNFSERGQVISVQALLKHHPDPSRRERAETLLKKHERVITSIARLRDHQLAHLNAEHLADPSKLLQRFPVQYDEVESLLEDLSELFTMLNPEPGHGYILDNYTKEPLREGKHTMEKIQYFDRKKEEYLDRFVAGEINDYKFPPDTDSP
ncbi:MAG: hypothetical protein ACM3TU_03670 [Bacillota bacterium]